MAKNSKILILGLAYKKDVDDPRESPSFEIINKLLHLGANISYHDPHITKAPKMRSWPGLPQLESVRLSKEVLNEQDLVVIVTAHSNIDYEFIQQESRTVVDSRGVYSKKYNNVIKA